MALNFSSIQDVYGCDYSELSRNKNKHSTTLEHDIRMKIIENLKKWNPVLRDLLIIKEVIVLIPEWHKLFQKNHSQKNLRNQKKARKIIKAETNQDYLHQNSRPPPPPPPQHLEEDSSSDEESDNESLEEEVSNNNRRNETKSENKQLKRQIDESIQN